MKMKILIPVLLVLCIEQTFAQKRTIAQDNDGFYQRGDLTLNLGLSLGAIGYGYGLYSGASGFVPVFANLEYSLNDKFAVGPYAGFYSRSYSNGAYKFTSVTFGARGTFHASSFLNDIGANINTEKLDLYASLHLGFEGTTWKYKDQTVPGFYSNTTRFIFGPVIGARYWFSPAFGAFVETGRGALGWFSLGLSGRF
jgi:hypothetical protein